MVCGCKWRWLIASCLLFPLAAPAAAPAAVPPSKQPAPAVAPAADAQPAEARPGEPQPDKSDRSPDSDNSKSTDGESKPSDGPSTHEPGGESKPASKGGESSAPDRKSEDEYYGLYKALADTIDQVERNYVKPVDRRELMEAAIKGIVSKLDPYSAYISPDEIGGFRDTVESQFGGIGIQVTIDEGQLKIITPLVGTPAYRAGVQAGDQILKIDAQPTDNITLDEATRRLKGEVGSSVTLTVQHAASGKTETFSIKRELIHVGTVLGDSRKPDDSWDFMLNPETQIGYIRVTAFSRDTAADLRKALEDLKARKMRALILDLRFNPGGLLSTAVEVSNLFISKGRIVSTKGRNTPERVWDAVKSDGFEGFPMVVLVNRYSASASEIVAACLQDNGRAVVAGDRTWGKGSVQNVVELESGKSALKLTTSGYTRPNGHKIHRFPEDKETDEWGVKPDQGLEVKLANAELAALLNYRRERDVVEGKHQDAKQKKRNGDKLDSTAGQSQGTGAGSKSDDSKRGEAKSNASKSEKTKTADAKSGGSLNKQPSAADKSPPFADRQLQKAIEYLTTELARAP